MKEHGKQFDSRSFLILVNEIYGPLGAFINFAVSNKDKHDIISNDFLGRAKFVATRLEELLDHYNAKNNLKWRPFRDNIATIKRFTDISYITLHLKSTSPQYRLLSGIDTFLADTDRVLNQFSSSLYEIFDKLTESAVSLGIEQQEAKDSTLCPNCDIPNGRLDADLTKTRIDNPEQVIVNLATSYLNLASESVLLKKITSIQSNDHKVLVPEVINENSIRTLESKFHNLQSLYDTYISNTDIEDTDKDLKLIRGHASIVYHLLEASTSIIHYYERHMMHIPEQARANTCIPIKTGEILNILVDYYLNYAQQFLTAGKTLCKKVIKRYAEEGTINVSVPIYRGFHVRPSTLVAKIIQHYGSEVYIILGNSKFDASSPMNLFRVNEEINAVKRRNLARNISNLKAVAENSSIEDFEKGLKEIFHELLEENKIINYASDFTLPEIKSISEESLGEYANRAIASLLAQGKIDLRTDLTVTFVGDKRVLADLEVLASCGYGEDSYGNNIVLPEELSYLRR
ncbi:MAG: HPr family phosphocarrier protein [Spirochaetales bacterium]|uniref:HPr family phosphocarrier protein n=1 Tax=Candidatus Thalassospirochaeta sargassi TaxID=3119039 RepID=A0AAJ1MPI4_9SPIO|nr:HPr family phosphocarrier protein [Spirochaetales bacterium]